MFCTMSYQINLLEVPFLNVDSSHLHRYNSELYSQLVRYPQEVIPTFDMATNELFAKLYPDTILEHQIQVGVGELRGGGRGWYIWRFCCVGRCWRRVCLRCFDFHIWLSALLLGAHLQC